MFSTLRHGFGEGKPFVSVETIPPFGKDQQPLRLSCEACRAKKTKCVKGANGCMRCMNQKRKCEYQTRSNFGSGATASRARSNSSTSPAPASIISTAREDSGESSSSANKKVQKRRRFQGQPKEKSWSSSSSQVTTMTDRSGGVLVSGEEEEEEDTEFDTAFLAGSGGEMQEFLEMHFFSGASTGSPEPMAVDNTASAAATATGATSITEPKEGQPQGGAKLEQQDEVSAAAAAEAAASSESLISAVDEVGFLAFDDAALNLSWSPPKDNHLPPPAGPCFCMSTAVGIYETIQVELIWNSQHGVSVGRHTSSAENPRASSSSSSPPRSSSSSSPSSAQARLPPAMTLTEQTILQRQKTALAQFESLFWCDSCWTRSDYVMLIITMCDLILTSLEAVVELLGRGPREASDAMARLEMEAGSWLSAAEPATAEVDDPADGLFKTPSSSSSSSSSLPSSSLSCSPFTLVGAADGVGFREGSSAGGGQRQQQQQSGLRIGTWQLDDDDEMVVVTGLLKVRMVRLSNLITKAEGVVGANGWPVHERMTQALRRRFDKIMVLLSFGGHFVAI